MNCLAAVHSSFARSLLAESKSHRNCGSSFSYTRPGSESLSGRGRSAGSAVYQRTHFGNRHSRSFVGRPVVAPALGCLPEAVPEGTGWLYRDDSDNALRNALLSAAGPLTATTSESCLRSALRYDWRGVGEKTAQLYARLFPG